MLQGFIGKQSNFYSYIFNSPEKLQRSFGLMGRRAVLGTPVQAAAPVEILMLVGWFSLASRGLVPERMQAVQDTQLVLVGPPEVTLTMTRTVSILELVVASSSATPIRLAT